MEALDLGLHIGRLPADHALGDLNVDSAAADAGAVHPAADLLHHVTGFKIRPGEVDGHGHRLQSRRLLLPHVEQHLLQHIEVQLVDQHALFQNGDEGVGHEHAVHRIKPPGQRLLIA